MSDQQFTHAGFVTELKPGRFPNQYEATLNDGFQFQVYAKKKDGGDAKVWPLILRSRDESLSFMWQGNAKTVSGEHGERTYYTCTWGKDDAGGGEHSTWGSPANTEGAAPTTPTAVTNDAPTNVTRMPNVASTTHEIEAAWAINTILATDRDSSPKTPEEVAVAATNLVILKRRVANKLAQESGDAA